MAKGPLRQAIEDFAFTTANPEGGPGYIDRVKTRWKAYWASINELAARGGVGAAIYSIINIPAATVYAVFGVAALLDRLEQFKGNKPMSGISASIHELIQSTIESEGVTAIASLMGDEITKPLMDLFQEYAGNDDKNPDEFIQRLENLLNVLNLTHGIVATTVEILSAGQLQGVSSLISTLYNSLGLGLLSELSWRPLVTQGIHPTFDRFYNAKYRQARFGPNDLRDLYALGEISPELMRNEAKLLGWRDSDIDKWIKLAFRTLTQGDVFDAFHQGYLSEDQAVGRLRALGYDPQDIPLLFKLNPKEETNEAKSFSVSNARNAFSEGLINEAELRKILKDLKYTDREIDIIVALEKLSKETKDRLLSAADIKSAWTENVLTDQEARHWLEAAGFAPEQLDILIGTWKQQVIPDYRKLNAGTIEGAYVEGILTRSQARDKLISVGFVADDAELELSLVEARNPESFGKPAPVTPKKLTPGILSELVSVGLITPTQMLTRLVDLGYSQEDANLLSEAARISAIPTERVLPQKSIEDAFFAGILNRPDALERLKVLGFSDQNAKIVLDTVQAQLDAIQTAKEEAQRKRLTAGTLEQLVIAGIITSDEMKARLIENGYTEIDADLLTQRAILLAAAPVRIITQSTIERAYLVGVLTRDQAKQKLIDMDFTAEDAENILQTVERENVATFHPEQIQSTRQPTIGTLVNALQMQILTQDEYTAKTQELGYTPEDAALYLSIAVKAERKSTKQLSVSQIANAYGAGFMPFPIALSRITQNGYSDADALLILRLEKDLIQNTDVWAALMAGTLDPFEAVAQLVNMSYSDKDIVDAFSALGPVVLSQMGVDLAGLSKALAETPGGQ